MTCCLQVGAKEIQNRGMLQVNMIDKLLAKIIFNQLNQFKPYVKHPNFKRIIQYLVILEYIRKRFQNQVVLESDPLTAKQRAKRFKIPSTAKIIG